MSVEIHKIIFKDGITQTFDGSTRIDRRLDRCRSPGIKTHAGVSIPELSLSELGWNTSVA